MMKNSLNLPHTSDSDFTGADERKCPMRLLDEARDTIQITQNVIDSSSMELPKSVNRSR